MSQPLRYINPNVFKIVQRCCRPYSTQVDGLRIESSLFDSSTLQELSNYQEKVTNRVAAILEEGKKLATSVCASSSLNDDNFKEITNLVKKANDLQAQLAATAIVPYFNFYNPKVGNERDSENEAALSKELLLQRLVTDSILVQSYSYAGDTYTDWCESNNKVTWDGQVLDQVFNIESTGPLPQHLLAFVRENTNVLNLPHSVSADGIINSQKLYLSELQSATCINDHTVLSTDDSPKVQSKDSSSKTPWTSEGNDEGPPRPSKDHLIRVHEIMNEQLPRILLSRHEYRIYRPDVIFENNFYEKSYTTKGIGQYVVEIAKLRVWAHFKYANVKMTLLKSTIEEEEGTVTFHWRMSGLPQVRAFMFWKFLPWTYKKNVKNESDWHDGISTFYVDSSGLIQKHKIDRMMVDKEYEPVEAKKSLREKLNKLIEPKPAIGTAYHDSKS